MKGSGGGSPRHDRLLDKDELKIDLDSFSHHGEYYKVKNRGPVNINLLTKRARNSKEKGRNYAKLFKEKKVYKLLKNNCKICDFLTD